MGTWVADYLVLAKFELPEMSNKRNVVYKNY